jgi:hypothetical protein
MKHTPGPWRTHAWGDLPNSPDVNYEILSGVDTALARIDLAFDDDTGDPKVEADEMAANARLIAAAPELLEALLKMRYTFTSDGTDDQHKACCMADAAIASAVTSRREDR